MLEVGGGEGLFSLWALANGVGKVILLEPEADGVTEGVGKRFINHKKALSIPNEPLMFFPLPCRNTRVRGRHLTWFFHTTP